MSPPSCIPRPTTASWEDIKAQRDAIDGAVARLLGMRMPLPEARLSCDKTIAFTELGRLSLMIRRPGTELQVIEWTPEETEKLATFMKEYL